MSKILKSFGMAALLVALLAGIGAADPVTGDAQVDGCVLQYDYELVTTLLTATVDLGPLPTIAAKPGGSVDVKAKSAWKLTAVDVDTTPSGKMKLVGTPATQLSTAFEVNNVDLDITETIDPVQIANGAATCKETVSIDYDQPDGVGTDYGAFRINVRLAVGAA